MQSGSVQSRPVRADAVPEPKYRHLKSVLSEALENEFTVGQILPNERELAARFGVARATLRQALEQLELEGRLQRRRGVGTTVAPPRVPVEVGPGAAAGGPGTAEEEWRAGECGAAPLPAPVAAELGLPAGAVGVVVRRGRLSHGQQVATEMLYVPQSAGPTPAADAVLAELAALPRDGHHQSVELGSARPEDARLLDRLPGAPVLVVTTRYRSAGRVVALAVATYRADTCRLSFAEPQPLPAAA